MQRIYPYLLYEDVAAASDFLGRAFGFRRVEVPATGYDHSSHSHIEMEIDTGFRIRMTGAGADYRNPGRTGQVTSMLQIDVTDIDAHFARAQAAGATVVTALRERRYGDRGYTADDSEGQRWSFIQRDSGATAEDLGQSSRRSRSARDRMAPR